VYQLKREFPQLTIVLNGGVTTNAQIAEHLQHVDGVMIGREAYHNPWLMADWDARFFGVAGAPMQRDAVEAALVGYMAGVVARGEPWAHVARHMLGLRNGLPGARRWRQVWSDHHLKALPPAEVARLAYEAMGIEGRPAAWA
jgi:tRNA-dihydrouridine synthase A